METTLALIPILPLLGFLTCGFLGKRLGKRPTAVIACAGPLVGFVLAFRLLGHLSGGGEAVETVLYTWIASGDLTLEMAFLCDQLTATMLLVVTGVGSLIHIYSAEYMEEEDDGGYARYFAYLNLFTAMMLVLVTAANVPLMFIGWEGVGLCSYLLIGFWYKDLKNAEAGRKAFIVNRVGDFGFLLGIFILWVAFQDLTFEGIKGEAMKIAEPSSLITVACLLLLLGAAGKSAQIPLYVWLPDAMAGPTPVSALIHAATMVTAGVYMVARLGAVFALSPVALGAVATVGVLTALLAATMALTENDLKKVLAYSTISQLGYMFLGVGTGVFAAGIFHLVTHAFFKALLFLGAGAVMHAVHHIDMRRMGGLRQKMPYTFWLFLIGALGLAGIPPFSGFFSKDEILGLTFAKFLDGHGLYWLLLWLIGLMTAGLTAFYTFRAVSLTFFGENRGSVDDHVHAHDPGPSMLFALCALGVLAAFGGLLNFPELMGGNALFFRFLAPVVGAAEHGGGHEGAAWFAVAATTATAILCAYAAYWVYTRHPDLPDAWARHPKLERLYKASSAKYWVDEVYRRVFVTPVVNGARTLWRAVDVAVIDETLHWIADTALAVAASLRGIQGGLLNQYAFYLAGGAFLVLILMFGSG
ncbi:NADH-quinone oxidoreductase subunit L [Planctomycetota bacterium]